MKIKNRSELLHTLRESCAYRGKPDLAEVKVFIAEQGIDLVDADDKPIDLETVWAKTVRIGVTADAGEDVEVSKSAPADGDSLPEGEATKRSRLFAAHKHAAIRGEGVTVASVKALASANSRKRYNAKAAQGLAKFGDAEAMEAFNAAYRQTCLELCPGVKAYYPEAQREADRDICGKDGSELVNTLGGALVADDFRKNLIYATEPYGIARFVANVVNMTGGNTIFPRKTGIITMTATAQTGTLSSADNTYDNVQLTAKQYGVIIKSQRQLFSVAAIDVGDDIATSILEAYYKRCDQNYFLGDGTSTYNGDAGLAVALPSSAYLAAGSAWSAVTKDAFSNAPGFVENADMSRCVWVMSRQAYYQTVVRLGLALGGNTASNFIDGSFGKTMGSILGTPCYFSQVLPTASPATTVPWAYFGDFTGASMLGIRTQLEITPSSEAGFAQNQIWTRGVAEIAVNIHGDGRASTYGPIVALKTT